MFLENIYRFLVVLVPKNISFISFFLLSIHAFKNLITDVKTVAIDVYNQENTAELVSKITRC